MNYEEESARLGDEYRAALKRAQDCEAFYKEHPIVSAIAPGESPPRTETDILIKATLTGTPDAVWKAAMTKLWQWRSYRAAHGHA